MLPDKTPVQSFQWDEPAAAPKATQCRENQKEGDVIHVGEVFKNNVKDSVGYSHMAMISQMPGRALLTHSVLLHLLLCVFAFSSLS